MPRDRTSLDQGRIIITGTGRAGTTFLMQLFTALRFNTGYSLQEAFEAIDEISQAGLERALVNKENPYVIKSPWFALTLDDALASGAVAIHAALIPVRSLFAAAESRRRVYHEAQDRGLDGTMQPGSLWHTQDPSNQETILAQMFYETVFALVKYEIPIYLLDFPRLVRDTDYLFRRLEPLMTEHGVTRLEFETAYRGTARPELVHEFAQKPGAL